MEKLDKSDFNKEKEYIWERLSELTQELNLKANLEDLRKLEISIPESLRDAAQSSRKTSEYRNKAQKAKDEVEQAKGIIYNFKSDSESAYERISQVDSSSEYIHGKLQTLLDNADSKYEDLVTAYNESTTAIGKIKEITQEYDTLVETINYIHDYKEECDSSHGKIKNLLSQSAALKREIDNVHDEIFGYDSTDADSEKITRVEGLRDKLAKTYKELRAELSRLSADIEEHKSTTNVFLKELKSDAELEYEKYIDNCNESYDDVLQRIRKLLPQAMTAGLASAYNDKIEAEIAEQNKHETSFNKAILYLFLISLLPFAVNAYRLFGRSAETGHPPFGIRRSANRNRTYMVTPLGRLALHCFGHKPAIGILAVVTKWAAIFKSKGVIETVSRCKEWLAAGLQAKVGQAAHSGFFEGGNRTSTFWDKA